MWCEWVVGVKPGVCVCGVEPGVFGVEPAVCGVKPAVCVCVCVLWCFQPGVCGGGAEDSRPDE